VNRAGSDIGRVNVGVADLTFGYADNGTNGRRNSRSHAAFDIGASDTSLTAVVLDQDAYTDTVYAFGEQHDLGGGTFLPVVFRTNRNGANRC